MVGSSVLASVSSSCLRALSLWLFSWSRWAVFCSSPCLLRFSFGLLVSSILLSSVSWIPGTDSLFFLSDIPLIRSVSGWFFFWLTGTSWFLVTSSLVFSLGIVQQLVALSWFSRTPWHGFVVFLIGGSLSRICLLSDLLMVYLVLYTVFSGPLKRIRWSFRSRGSSGRIFLVFLSFWCTASPVSGPLARFWICEFPWHGSQLFSFVLLGLFRIPLGKDFGLLHYSITISPGQSRRDDSTPFVLSFTSTLRWPSVGEYAARLSHALEARISVWEGVTTYDLSVSGFSWVPGKMVLVHGVRRPTTSSEQGL